MRNFPAIILRPFLDLSRYEMGRQRQRIQHSLADDVLGAYPFALIHALLSLLSVFASVCERPDLKTQTNARFVGSRKVHGGDMAEYLSDVFLQAGCRLDS
jgi:hypothetical protein